MKRIYNVGADQSKIQIEVTVTGTPGIPSTIVQQRWSGGQIQDLGSSNNQLGNVKLTIGTGQTLRNSYVLVFIYISLPHIKNEDAESILKNARIDYLFKGGASNDQTFHPDADDIVIDKINKSALIIKPFKMV